MASGVGAVVRMMVSLVLFGVATIFLLGAVLFLISAVNEGGEIAPIAFGVLAVAGIGWFTALRGMISSFGGAKS